MCSWCWIAQRVLLLCAKASFTLCPSCVVTMLICLWWSCDAHLLRIWSIRIVIFIVIHWWSDSSFLHMFFLPLNIASVNILIVSILEGLHFSIMSFDYWPFDDCFDLRQSLSLFYMWNRKFFHGRPPISSLWKGSLSKFWQW